METVFDKLFNQKLLIEIDKIKSNEDKYIEHIYSYRPVFECIDFDKFKKLLNDYHTKHLCTNYEIDSLKDDEYFKATDKIVRKYFNDEISVKLHYDFETNIYDYYIVRIWPTPEIRYAEFLIRVKKI